jgi:hypothetical protein
MKQITCIFLICLAAMFISAATVAAAVPSAPGLLKQGMSGDEVYKLQAKLLEFGYLEDGPDGKFGSQTKLAVIQFQLDCGLESDGVAGPDTIKALRDYKPETATASRGVADRKGQQLASYARQYVGVPYVWAGRSPAGFDCSGFVWYVYSNFGIGLPRMADGQFEVGQQVSRRDLVPGDLVFFSTYEPGPSHVGIYIGNGNFVHASSGAAEVVVTPMSKAYYVERYLGARRVLR